MKRLILSVTVTSFLILAAVLPSAVLAQSEADLTMESAQELLERWTSAYVAHDAEALAELVTDDVVTEQIDPTGTLQKAPGTTGSEHLIRRLKVDWNLGTVGVATVVSVDGDTVQTAEVWQNIEQRKLGVMPLYLGEVTFRDGKIAHYVTRWQPQSVAALHQSLARKMAALDMVQSWGTAGNEVLAYLLADDAKLNVKEGPTGGEGMVQGKLAILERVGYLQSLGVRLLTHVDSVQGDQVTLKGMIAWPHLREVFGATLPVTVELTFVGDKIQSLVISPSAELLRVYQTMAEASGVVTPTVVSEEEPKGGLVHLHHVSPALAGNLIGDPAGRDLAVYLPPGYQEEARRFPVTYILHWYTGKGSELPAQYVNHYERGLAEGKYPPMILAFVDCWNTFGGCYYTDSATNGGYGTYVSDELVGLVDSKFRTLPQAASRGVTGCSMGGVGAIVLALRNPGTFGVSVPMAAGYTCEDPLWVDNTYSDMVDTRFTALPVTMGDYIRTNWRFQEWYAIASYVSPNADNPPLYLDPPFEETAAGLKFSPEWVTACNEQFPTGLVDDYLAQPLRLRGLQLYHGTHDEEWSIEHVREFSAFLAESGIEHDLLEVDAGHCGYPLGNAFDYIATKLALEMEE